MNAPVISLPVRRSLNLPAVEARMKEARRLLRGDLFSALLARREADAADDMIYRHTRACGYPPHGTPEAAEMQRAVVLWREIDDISDRIEGRVRKVRRDLPIIIGGHHAAQNDQQ